MDMNIICWNLKDRLNLNSIKGSFKEISEKEEIYYLRMEKKRVEVIVSNSNDFEEGYISKKNNNKLSVIIVDEITMDNLKMIKESIECNNSLVMCGKISLDNNEEVLNLRKIVKVPQLYYDTDEIDIMEIILITCSIYVDEEFSIDEISGSQIIFGSKDLDSPLGEVPLYILKKFNYLKSLIDLNLTLYIREEMSIENLTYIEDPLREYIEYDSVLKIKQNINKEIREKIYFSLIAK